METGCQGGHGSPRAVAPGGWMDGWMDGITVYSHSASLMISLFRCVVKKLQLD